jgi:hypothetical protein
MVSAISCVVLANMEPVVAVTVLIVPPNCKVEGTVVPLSASNPSVKVVVTPAAPIVAVPELRNVTRFWITEPFPRIAIE